MIVPPSAEKIPPRPARVLLQDAHDTQGPGAVERLRAFAAIAVRPALVLTALRPFTALPEKLVRDQWDAALASGPLDAALFGDLGNAARVSALAEWLEDAPQLRRRVLDPELVRPDGEARHPRGMAATLNARLLPLMDVVVAGAGDLAGLIGREVESLAELRDGARRLFDRGVPAVVVTGGRLDGHPIDYLFEGKDFIEFGTDRIRTAGLRGAGATFSALLVGHLGRGLSLSAALQAAKDGVTAALRCAQPEGEAWSAEVLGEAFEALGFDPAPIEPTRAELV